MKTIVVFLFVVLTIGIKAQEKKVTISETKIGGVSCKYIKRIDLDKGDSITYIYIGFTNAKYKTLTDIKSIMFDTTNDSTDVFEFIKDLKKALPEIGKKTNLSWNRESYKLNIYDFNKWGMYLSEPHKEGDGYTILKKNHVEKLIEWLEEIGF